MRQLPIWPFQNAFRPENEFRRIVWRKCGRCRRWPRPICAGDRRRRIDPHPGGLLWGIWLQTGVWKSSDTFAPNLFGATSPFIFEGPLTRTVEDAALILSVLAGYDPRDPYALDEAWNWQPGHETSLNGWRIAYARNFGDFPVSAEVAVGRSIGAVTAFEEAGARVDRIDLDFRHSHLELSDIWCRLISVGNLRILEHLQSQGIDLLGDHAEDLPPQLREWLDRGRLITATEYLRDQEIRSRVYEAIQSVFTNYRLLVTPTLACAAVPNAEDGNTIGPDVSE